MLVPCFSIGLKKKHFMHLGLGNENYLNLLSQGSCSFSDLAMDFLKGTKQQSKGRNNMCERKIDVEHCCTKIHG